MAVSLVRVVSPPRRRTPTPPRSDAPLGNDFTIEPSSPPLRAIRALPLGTPSSLYRQAACNVPRRSGRSEAVNAPVNRTYPLSDLSPAPPLEREKTWPRLAARSRAKTSRPVG